ncbi:malto-oligosyltrehalose synthase [Streptomyces griseoloalbus]|uniref:(1->4)-alpha-D-glucan 1-alpha-D-glucosylmutase n=1 Tax=Streptomyces griseoloalbus TaxID=67303 RepID=A0A7W8BJK6_9ACTN|nr:malto-oligosyltrehalose synthase [Streptomyces albaduncus]MBB5124629.1 (1->4)-alpha-D-glucan 1-alpha-D-glucosylmutase [Streptomyces albaduncus]GGW38295.1 malto-oligosyltrehalose synthase [Streptomyces albaduncus]
MTPERPDPAVPTATYRLQLQPGFPFGAAADAVPYVASLGVSHLHLSPVLEAVPGSAHGYDVVDHTRVREELGGEEGLRELARTAREHGLGLVVDIVPNHMAMSPRHNHALWEVLRDGPASRYARWFDIDWEAQGGQVLLPVLGGPLGTEIDRLRTDGDVLRYYDHVFPLREGTAQLPLPQLLDAQWYRPVWWRLARTELNYRRFFSISELIGVRVEDPEVFEATHATVLRLLREGVIDGLRVDHPDGLADPDGYLRRLHEATGGRWTVVEKILSDGEPLPASWPVAGTTGYDALRHVDGLFTDPAGFGELLGQYRRFAAPQTDRGGDWGATVRRAAYKVLTHELATEVDRLTRVASRLCATSPEPGLRDRAPWALRTALLELLVRLEVYRPYTSVDAAGVVTEEAAAEARLAFAVPEEAGAVDVVRDLVLGRYGDGPRHVEFRTRFAQTASALRAKSVEDTAFYRYVPLLSANEVGGDPGSPAVSPERFHAYCARVQRDWPATGTVVSTHDTKRSADVRAALHVLTECPGRWADVLAEVTRTGEGVPDAQVAWAAWQTVFGLGPAEEERVRGALLKHVREAGLYTSWTEQEPPYEEAVARFVAAGPCGVPGERVAAFRAALEPHIRANVLGTALVQLTMPGVPDLYQGTEHEYRALVDPDNRRTVAFPSVPAAGAVTDADADAYAAADAKEVVTRAALGLRARRPEVFGDTASYAPLTAEGPAAAHCPAFVRSGEVLTAVTRLSLRLTEAGGWRGTRLPLPPGRWTDVLEPGREFTGHARVADLFERLPVALLERVPD